MSASGERNCYSLAKKKTIAIRDLMVMDLLSCLYLHARAISLMFFYCYMQQ